MLSLEQGIPIARLRQSDNLYTIHYLDPPESKWGIERAPYLKKIMPYDQKQVYKDYKIPPTRQNKVLHAFQYNEKLDGVEGEAVQAFHKLWKEQEPNRLFIQSGTIEPLFNDNGEQFTHHTVAIGCSGSGKTTALNKILQTSGRPSLAITVHVGDPSLGDIEMRHPQDIVDMEPALELDELKGRNVIFDDIENLLDPRVQHGIVELRNDIITNGRHHDICGAFSTHSILQGHISRPLFDRCRRFVLFPSRNRNNTNRILDKKFGFNARNRDLVQQLGKESRSVMLNMHAPMYILSDKALILL